MSENRDIEILRNGPICMPHKITQIKAAETYDLRHTVMWPDQPREFIILDDDEEGIHFGLWKDLELISVISLYFTGSNSARFRKFATKTSEQGNGYGTILLQHLIDYTFENNYERLWCGARQDKASFYKRFGMAQTNETYIKKGVDFVVMEIIQSS